MCGMLFDKPMVHQAGSTERSEARMQKSEGRYSPCVGCYLEQTWLIRDFLHDLMIHKDRNFSGPKLGKYLTGNKAFLFLVFQFLTLSVLRVSR